MAGTIVLNVVNAVTIAIQTLVKLLTRIALVSNSVTVLVFLPRVSVRRGADRRWSVGSGFRIEILRTVVGAVGHAIAVEIVIAGVAASIWIAGVINVAIPVPLIGIGYGRAVVAVVRNSVAIAVLRIVKPVTDVTFVAKPIAIVILLPMITSRRSAEGRWPVRREFGI